MFDAQRKVARHLTFIFLTIAGGWSPFACSQQPNSVPELVNKLIPELMNKHSIPGMAVAVSYDDKDYLFEFGVQDKNSKVPVSDKTLFEVGSISKLFNATLAAKADAEGAISLDNPTSNYLPYLKGAPLGAVPLFHLATHTAGGFMLQLPKEIKTEHSLTDYYKDWQPSYAIGTQRAYANPSIALLGQVTANVYKSDFSSLLTKEVLKPLGLNNTYLNVPKTALANYAWGHSKNGKRARLNKSLLSNEAYGIKTTHQDLLQFLKANFIHGKPQGSLEQALLRTHKSHFDTGMFHQALIWDKFQYPIDPCKLKQGNSYQVILNNTPVKLVDSNSQGYKYYVLSKTGSTFGFGAYAFAVPHKKLAITLLANKNYPNQARVKTAYLLMAGILGEQARYCE